MSTKTSKAQIFTIPTFDAAFKWILSLDSIRPSFFHAFIPNLAIKSSVRVDDHMNPLKALQLVRQFVHDSKTQATVDHLTKAKAVEVHFGDPEEKLKYNKSATEFLSTIVRRFEDIKIAFPKPRFDGTMDFVCELDTGELTIVEMQVTPKDYWDRRALAYAAALYSNQMKAGMQWGEIKRVIAINILGGDQKEDAHWKETPTQYMRQYKMQEQIHGESRFLDGIEVIQYSLANAPKEFETQEQRDWILFFKNAHHMTEQDVIQQIKTPEVLIAFQRAKLNNLPPEVRAEYDKQDAEYQQFSIHTAGLIAEGKAEGKAEGIAEGITLGEVKKSKEMAKKLIKRGLPLEEIAEDTDLTLEEIKNLMDEIKA